MSIDLYDGKHTIPDVDADQLKLWQQTCYWEHRSVSSSVLFGLAREGGLGKRLVVPVEGVCPASTFDCLSEVLSLYDRKNKSFKKRCPDTKYFKRRHKGVKSLPSAWKCVDALIKVLQSMRANGFSPQKNEPKSFPWMLVDSGLLLRLDGTKRAAVARYLGHKTIPIIEIRAEECMAVEASLRR